MPTRRRTPPASVTGAQSRAHAGAVCGLDAVDEERVSQHDLGRAIAEPGVGVDIGRVGPLKDGGADGIEVPARDAMA